LLTWLEKWSLIEYSVGDTRRILRLLAALVSWQLLSTDYSSLVHLAGDEGPMALPGCLRPTMILERHALQHVGVITALQWLAVLALAAGVWRFRRGWVMSGLACVCFLEWAAYRFRGQFYDLDLGTALLAIATLVPLSWRGLRGEEKGDRVANAIGRALAIYVATAYFLCGCSKLLFDPRWWQNVHLEYILDALRLWNSVTLPEPILTSASWLREAFLQWPWLGPAGALATLGCELLWFTALIGPRGRPFFLLVPLGMLSCHLLILLASGLNFMPFGLSAFVVLAPWARGDRDSGLAQPDAPATAPATATATAPATAQVASAHVAPAYLAPAYVAKAYLTTAFALACLPAVLANHYFPFANFNQFGWSYAATRSPREIYRLGYVHPTSGAVEVVPVNYGAFMGFRWVTLSGAALQALVESKTDAERQRYAGMLERYIAALRPYQSNRRWLGPLALPDHVMGASARFDMAAVQQFTVLRGESRPTASGLDIQWTELARFRPGQSDGTAALTALRSR
jgi:hypothetical protein